MKTIRLASAGELPVVVNILDEAARWLLSRGIRQWESPPPPECEAELARHIANQRVYLVRAEGEAIGTFRLEWEGAPLWPDRKNAGYLYALALRPRYIGQGIGRFVIEWVRQHVREQGKDSLRLDCIATNGRLRYWYEQLGFAYRGTGTAGTYVLARYERLSADPQAPGLREGSEAGSRCSRG